jgi:hypothetical protein
MTARDRDDVPEAPTLQLDAIDPSVADAPNNVSLGALLGIQRRAHHQPSRLARTLRTSVVLVLWLGTAAGATTAAWTVHDLLHDEHVTDDVLLPNLDLRPAGTPTTVVAPILPNITLAPSSSTSSEGGPATAGPSDVELRAGTTADDGNVAGGGNPSGGRPSTTTSAVGGSPSGTPTAGPTTRGSTAPTVGDEGGPDTTTGSSSGPGSGPDSPTTHGGSGNPNPSGPGTTPTTQNNNGPGGGGGAGGGAGGSPGGPPTTTAPTVGPLVTLSGTGGSVDVRCTGDTITLLASRPLSGYNSDVQESGPAKARVRFISTAATYKIEAHCTAGSLVRDVVQ